MPHRLGTMHHVGRLTFRSLRQGAKFFTTKNTKKTVGKTLLMVPTVANCHAAGVDILPGRKEAQRNLPRVFVILTMTKTLDGTKAVLIVISVWVHDTLL